MRSVTEYASAVFTNLPKYLSDALEGIQKGTLRIILPNLHYDEALILSGLLSLEDRRAAACESFMRNFKTNQPCVWPCHEWKGNHRSLVLVTKLLEL